jgi:hypothetical protein
MNTYTWQIKSLDCLPEGKVVSSIHWRLKGDDGTNIAELYGIQNIENNSKNPFIDYEQLVKDDVIEWLKAAMGEEKVTQLHQSLDKQIETLANPPIVTLPLPWNEA